MIRNMFSKKINLTPGVTVASLHRGVTLRYPAILTNALVPQPTLSSILQNQLGVALDALTMRNI